MPIVAFVASLIKKGGFKSLYIGITAKMIQTVLYNAFMMTTYEKLRLFIKFLLLKYLNSKRR
jgi:hypothetical protein